MTRWQWARHQVGHPWVEQVGVGALTGLGTYIAGMAEDVASIGVGVVAGLVWGGLRLAWHFSRAEIAQDRRELVHSRAELAKVSSDLQLKVWIGGVKWTSNGGTVLNEAFDVLVYQVRFNNRSQQDRVNLTASASVGLKNSKGRVQLDYGLNPNYVPPPISVLPQESWYGDLSFRLVPVIEAVSPPKGAAETLAFDTLELLIQDHISGKSMLVEGRRSPRK